MVAKESIVIRTGRRIGTVEDATEVIEIGIMMRADRRGNQRAMTLR